MKIAVDVESENLAMTLMPLFNYFGALSATFQHCIFAH